MDEILQLSPIREGKLQEDLQTMLISNEKKVTILAVLELTNSCTPPTWSEEMLNGISPTPPAWSSLVFRSLKIFHPQWNDLH